MSHDGAELDTTSSCNHTPSPRILTPHATDITDASSILDTDISCESQSSIDANLDISLIKIMLAALDAKITALTKNVDYLTFIVDKLVNNDSVLSDSDSD
jgi:hypothetical protein